ncbi:MAG: mechanosensitive ion channel family protein [Gammaproteobacteria bacterium]|nr:mechanosensitive ion channel family protein [Gammaproteobacteria bacterium]
MEILNQTIMNNTLLQWLIATTALLITVMVLRLAQHLISRRLTSISPQTEMLWRDITVALFDKTKILFLIIVGIFVGATFLQMPDRIQAAVSSLLVIALLFQAGIWGGAFIAAMLERYRLRALDKNRAAVTTINVIGLVSQIILWSIVVLLALDNLGINVTALVAGLGIGGIAVALALQNILGDLFASLSIMLDKPFIVGDFLIIGDFLGNVEYVGLKTTRLRSLSGEQLVFSNSDLLNSRIRNYGRMYERRVVFSIGVIYQTPRAKLKLIPEIIREAVEAQENSRFDRAHFSKYGNYDLQFEAVFYVLSPDYTIYMDIQQAIYFAIHERFEQEGIEFAYPTQTVYVTQEQPSEA